MDDTTPDDYIFDNDTNDIVLDELKCNQYILQNKTHFFYGGYGGIPENLLINFGCWLVLLCLFTLLRKKAWNYGRLALVQKHENRWTHIFYGTDKDQRRPAFEADSLSSLESSLHIDKGYFSWLPAIFKITDEHILSKSGRDAVQYLSFQRHVILYMMIVTVVCITVVLPINFQGTLEGGKKDFGHTTLANLNPNSPFMWVHVTLAFLFLPLGIVFTRHFTRSLEIRALTSCASRTLMIARVPRRACHKDTFLKHFQEAYPEIDVHDVQFAYDIKELVKLDKEREVAHSAKLYCESYFMDRGVRLEMRPYRCGVICCCCDIFGCPKVDAIEYYSNEESRLLAEVEEEKLKALQRPSGIAFVTFDSVKNADCVKDDHDLATCGKTAPTSSVSRELKPHNWVVRFAPPTEDIYWPNLSVTNKCWYLKAFFINLSLFLVLFFLTTPAVVITSLDLFVISEKLTQITPFLSEFLPTLMLWTVAALMPVIVAYSDRFMSHWTRSGENHSVMRKSFIFLLFMLIILPSLGFTSAKAFVEWVFHEQLHPNSTYRWECMFLPDSGAFFVNYVITSSFIGTTLELIRFPELFLYILQLGLARSVAETASIRKNILYEFQFGVQYAWMLLIFAMTMIYSIACPLITPFGLIYLIFKHFVDKYNIYFAYGPSKIRKSVHTSAVNFVVASLVILQCALLFSSILRQGLKKPLTIYSILLLVVTVLLFLMHVTFHWFKDLSPIKYKHDFDHTTTIIVEENIENDDSDKPEDDIHGSYQFVPLVLRTAGVYDQDTEHYVVPRTQYGTEGSPSAIRGGHVYQLSSGNNGITLPRHSQKTSSSSEINDVRRTSIDRDDDEVVFVRGETSLPVENSTPGDPSRGGYSDLPTSQSSADQTNLRNHSSSHNSDDYHERV